MNHLAHVLLAGENDEWRLGALLGDFVKGRDGPEQWPAAVAASIRMHRALDTWTDGHPRVVALRQQAPSELRRYMGIAVDVYFDHLLSRQWALYCPTPLPLYAQRVYALLDEHYGSLPPGLQRFSHYARRYDVLARYGETAIIDQVFAGIAGRLSRSGPLARARPLLTPLKDQLESVFAEFFPAAVAWAASWRTEAKSTITGS